MDKVLIGVSIILTIFLDKIVYPLNNNYIDATLWLIYGKLILLVILFLYAHLIYLKKEDISIHLKQYASRIIVLN